MFTEPIPFLANIILVAHADGRPSASETGQLEAIRREYRLKKSDLSAAENLVKGGNYQLTPIGTFADQVKNLELVLRVALADNALDPTEVDLISHFASVIGVNQDQLAKLHLQVLSYLEQAAKPCPSCQTDNPPDSRFCGKCGATLIGESQDAQLNFDVPKVGLAIEFAESTAASFPKALELAKASPGFQTCAKGSKTWYMAIFPSRILTDAMPLAEALSGIRNRNLFIDGQQHHWNDVFGFSGCAVERARAYRPLEYCFGKDQNRMNPWGCKQARMDWTEWSQWFRYGRWEKRGMIGATYLWRFDKERIKHELATNLYRFRYCPHLNDSLPEAILRHLPDTVDPGNDVHWGYHRNYEQTPGSIKVVEREKVDGMSFTDEYWADGVRPIGQNVLRDVLVKALGDLNADTAQVAGLMK